MFVDFNIAGARELFFLAIPEVAHRCQVIHHAVTTGTFFSLYVVSSTGEKGIIRMVLIRLCVGFHELYITPILHTFSNKLPWVYNNNIPVPNLSKANLGYFGDMDVLTQHLNLWRALTLAVLQNQKPFPPAKQIIPYVTSVWNRTKGGVDIQQHAQTHPGATLQAGSPSSCVFAYSEKYVLQQLPDLALYCRILFSEHSRCYRLHNLETTNL